MTAAGIDAETVMPTRSPKYAFAAQFDEKKVVLHNNKEIKAYLKTLSDNPSHKSTKEEREI